MTDYKENTSLTDDYWKQMAASRAARQSASTQRNVTLESSLLMEMKYPF